MHAITVREPGGPDVMSWQKVADPTPGPGEVIIDIAANLRYFETWDDGSSASMGLILRFYALNTPFLHLQVAPFVTTAAGFTATARFALADDAGSAALTTGLVRWAKARFWSAGRAR